MITLRAYKLNLKLKEPISISFHTWEYRENVIVELEYDGVVGYGEAAPFKPITGDSQDEVVEQLKQLGSLPFNPREDTPADLHAYLDERISAQTLKAALDFAYHDLQGKLSAKSCFELYTPEMRKVNNSVTIFVHEDFNKTQENAREVFSKYPDLQLLKIKLKGEGDLERARAIQAVAPKHIKFVLDANQGFEDPQEAVEVFKQLQEIFEGRVFVIEEPCPKGELDKLKFVTDNLEGIYVLADESAATIEDAKAVIDARAAHGVNIKLQKAGGIWPSKIIAQMCEEAGMKVMVGSMLEGPLSTAAGVHFAVSTPNVIFSDLDMDLEDPDYVIGAASFENGQRTPSNALGLGVKIDSEAIKKLVASGEMVKEAIAL